MLRNLVVVALLFSFSATAQVDPALKELRYCGPPARDSNGYILRRSDVLYAFRKAHPCPATMLTTGACTGWSIDHVIPLACGGCDVVSNLQWLPNELKSAAGTLAKDRWERLIYGNRFVYDNPACTPRIIIK